MKISIKINQIFFVILFILISFVNSSYNPVPIGSVIISTTHAISVLQPPEYGGTDKPTIIFTASRNTTIISTIFDPTSRDLHILYTNISSNQVYMRQLISVEKLSSIVYQLPISFNTSDINKLTSFSADIDNKRAFLTDQTGTVTMFSMSGLMKTILSTPSTIIDPIRSVAYNPNLNRLFIITDSTIDSCVGLDKNNLQCCQASQKTTRLRSITFDPLTIDSLAYVIDERSGIYQVILNGTGCPMILRPINTVGTFNNIQLAIDQELYFCSGSADDSNHNSILIIGNGSSIPRIIPFVASIVTLHLSYPNIKSMIKSDESCFHGITIHDYRVAVILAAIFGTIMGIFMCFNALFCIDFFMTKRILGELRKQIPNNLLEDRWNKLVEEKYAKLALELQRKKDDPPSKRKSFGIIRKTLPDDNAPSEKTTVNLQLPNPIPKISGYLRRKSESYLARRRSDDYRNQLQPNENRLSTYSNQAGLPHNHIVEGNEDDHHHRENSQRSLSQSDSTKNKTEIL